MRRDCRARTSGLPLFFVGIFSLHCFFTFHGTSHFPPLAFAPPAVFFFRTQLCIYMEGNPRWSRCHKGLKGLLFTCVSLFVFEVVIPATTPLSPLFVFDCLRADDMAYRDTTRRGTA